MQKIFGHYNGQLDEFEFLLSCVCMRMKGEVLVWQNLKKQQWFNYNIIQISICFIIIAHWKPTHKALFQPITDSDSWWWRVHLNLHEARLLCLVSALQSTRLLDATHCNAALTMLRLHFQSLLHARLQDTDMQIYMVFGGGFCFFTDVLYKG